MSQPDFWNFFTQTILFYFKKVYVPKNRADLRSMISKGDQLFWLSWSDLDRRSEKPNQAIARENFLQ